jgi:hypothetical protein
MSKHTDGRVAVSTRLDQPLAEALASQAAMQSRSVSAQLRFIVRQACASKPVETR